MADQLIIQKKSQTFLIKQLAEPPFQYSNTPAERSEAWEDTVRYLDSVLKKLFTFREISPNPVDTELFAPQIAAPDSRAAGLINFGQKAESQDSLRKNFLFIDDVYHLIYQVWDMVEREETLLNNKIKIAGARSLGESEEAAAWARRQEVLIKLRDDLIGKIRSLGRAHFEKYRYPGDTRLNEDEINRLVKLREDQSQGSPFKAAVEELLSFVRALKIEAAIDVGELVEVVKEEVAVADASVAEVAAPAEEAPEAEAETEAPEAEAETGGDTPPPDQPLPETRPERRPTPPDFQTQAVNNLKIITVETERLTRIYLDTLATTYNLSPDLLQIQNPMFREVAREDIRNWMMSELAAGRLDALYNPSSIREKQMAYAQAMDYLKATFQNDARFELFSDILVDKFKQVNQNPTDLAAYMEELKSGSFASPEVWNKAFQTFGDKLMATKDEAAASNLKGAIDSALDNPQASLAAQIDGLNIATLNLTDNPGRFNEDVVNIVNLIDVMAFGEYPPMFLSSLGEANFEALFNVELTTEQYQSLLPILETYWTIRVNYFKNNGVDLKIIGRGLDPDDVRDWFEHIPGSSKEDFFENYLRKIDERAANGRDVGGFHRIILSMRKKDPTQAGPKDEDGDGSENLDSNAIKEKRIKVLNELIAEAYNSLPDSAKLELLTEINPDMADIWMQTNYFPPEVNLDQLNRAFQLANTSNQIAPWSQAEQQIPANGESYASDGSPMMNAATGARRQIAESKNPIQNYFSKRARRKKLLARKAARKATKVAAQKSRSKAIEMGLNTMGSWIGMPLAGTVIMGFFNQLPDAVKPIATLMLVTLPAGLVGGGLGLLGSLFKGKPGLPAAGGGLSSALGGGGKPLYSPIPNPTTGISATAAKFTTITGLHPATQAVLGSVGAVTGITAFALSVNLAAFVANFPLPNQDQISNEKISKYLSLEKQVLLPAGCDQNTYRCTELAPGQTYQVTYTILLTSKGEWVVSITDILDEIRARFSKKKYEELGLPVPDDVVITKVLIPNTKPNSRTDFPELCTDPSCEENLIRPGEQLIITYTEIFSSDFNHAMIDNDFRADFYFIDGTTTGNDFVETAKSFCIGDCSMAEGCWPATGTDSQGPHEGCNDCTHEIIVAFDILNPHTYNTQKLKDLGVDFTKISSPSKIYAPFDGEVCFAPWHGTYGNYAILKTDEWNYWFAHMTTRVQDSGCRFMKAGEVIGIMGNTGTANMAIHLHYELRTLEGSVYIAGDPLGNQMPMTLLNNQPPKEDLSRSEADYVVSCYDQ